MDNEEILGDPGARTNWSLSPYATIGLYRSLSEKKNNEVLFFLYKTNALGLIAIWLCGKCS